MNPGKVDKKSMRFLLLFILKAGLSHTRRTASDALWRAEVFPGLNMKNYFFKGRDTIEKKMLGTLRLSQPTAC